MKHKLQDLIDIPFFKNFLNSLQIIHQFPSAIIDNEGEILLTTEWQDICTNFHRTCAKSEMECIKSDSYINSNLKKANPELIYKCRNGLIDIAIPIMINGEHYASFYSGQFLLESPDISFFKKNAKKYKYDEKEYLAALAKIPIWDKDQLDTILSVIKHFTEMIEQMATKKLNEIIAEHEINKKEEKFRNLFENMSQGVFYQDTDGKLIDVNNAALLMLGVSKDQFLGKTSYDKQWKVVDEKGKVLSPDQHPSMIAVKTGKAVANKTIGVYVPHLKKYNWLIINATPLFREGEKKHYCIFATIHDITKRKEAEDKAFESKERLEYIFENINAGIAFVSLSGEVISINKELLTITEFSEEEIVGKNILSIAKKYLKSKNLKQVLPSLLSIIQGKAVKPFNFELNNKILSIEANINFKTKRIIGIVKEITKSKLAEQEQFKLLNILENTLNEIYIFNADSLIFEYANKGALKNTGYTSNEICAFTPSTLAPEYTEAKLRKLIAPLISGKKETLVFETTHLRKNQTQYPIEVRLQLHKHEDKKVVFAIINDISERRLAELELKNNEEKYRQIVDTSPDAVIIQSHNKILFANPATLDLFEASSIDELNQYSTPEYIHPDFRIKAIKRLKHVFETGNSLGFSTSKIITLKKNIVDIEIISTLIQYDGKPAAQTIIRDISERIKIKTELDKSNELFRLLADKMTDVVWLMNLSGKSIFVSPSIEQFSGFTPEEYLNQTIPERFTPESAAYGMQIFAAEVKRYADNPAELKNYSKILVLEYLCKNGQTKWGELIITPYFNESGQLIGIHGVTRDITKRLVAEKELIKSEEKYRMLANNSADVIFTVNTNLEYTYISPSVEKLRGYSPNELIGKPISHSLNTDSYKSIVNSFKEELALEKTPSSDPNRSRIFEIEMPCKNGNTVWVEIKASLLRNNQNAIIGVLGITRDITEQKKINEALLESEERYRLLSEQSGLGMGLYDTEGNVITYNSKALLNMGGKLEDFKGKNIIEIFGDIEGNKFLKRIQQTASSENFYEFEDEVIINGKSFWFLSNFSKLVNAQKDIIGIQILSHDITSRKLADLELKVSSEKWITTFNSITDIVSVISKDHEFIEINKAGCDAIGLPREEIIGKKCYTLVHGTKHPVSNCPCLTTLATKTYATNEIFENGKYYHTSAWPIFDENGEVNSFSHSVKDITDRKIAEEEIKNNLLRLNSIVSILQYKEADTQLFLDYALEESLKLTNSKIGYIYFYDEIRKEFILNSWSKEVMDECKVINPQTCYELDKTGIWGEAVRQRKPIVINNYQEVNPLKKGHPKGHVKLTKFMTVPVFSNGKIVAVIGAGNKKDDYTQTDVLQLTLLMDAVWKTTNHKIAEDMLVKSENRYRTLFNEMLEGFALHEIICNEKGIPIDYRFLTVNEAFEMATGLKADTIIGKTVREVIPEVETFWIERYGKVALTGVPDSFDSFSAGLQKHYSVVVFSPEKNQFATIITDVTLQKKYEKDIISAKEKAEEADSLKSAFLANMSHEIRTPLNAIMGFSDLLTMPDITQKESMEFSEIIKNRSEDLLQIINDIIDISKIESNQMDLNQSEGSITSLIDNIYSFFDLRNQHLEHKPIELIKQILIPADSDYIVADFNRLQQIMVNLIGNAYKFTKQGKIIFGCEFTDDNMLQFFVKDTGIGIDAEKQLLIFERFRQANELYNSSEYGGNGLGLSISKGLIELMKGKIWVESLPGEGAHFFFTIPLQKSKQAKQAITPNKLEYNFENLSILLVEDDAFNLAFLKEIFHKINVDINVAENGKETLSVIKKLPVIDVVLLDLKLPDISGLELIEEIKKQHPAVKIIAQTAFASQTDKDNCLSAGCDYYISKPIVKKHLFDIIGEYIENRSM